MITVDDAFEVSPSVVSLWESYTLRLQETVVRFSATVVCKRRPSQRGSISRLPSVEVGTVPDAVAAILARRRASSSAIPQLGSIVG